MGSAVTRYVYAGEDIVLEYDGLNALQARYSHGDQTDEPLIQERGGQSYFYHADHLGSVRKITNGAGSVGNSYDYDSYGNIEAKLEGVANPYTFTAREFDAESGLYYYRARYYDALTGRFVSEDPLRFGAGATNLNRYTLSDPVNLTDPSGENPILAFALGCAAGAVAGGLACGSLDGAAQGCLAGTALVGLTGLGRLALRGLFGRFAGRAARRPTLAQLRALRNFGLDRAARREFFSGRPATFLSTTAGSPIGVLQLQGSRLSAGIFQINAPGMGLRAFTQFRSASTQLARTLGATELELGGIAVTNPNVTATLLRMGFTARTATVPESLGGGTVEVITRVFPVR